MRETLRQHLLESRARVFVPSLGGHRTLRILLCVFSETTVTANTKADPFGPLKQNRSLVPIRALSFLDFGRPKSRARSTSGLRNKSAVRDCKDYSGESFRMAFGPA